MAGEVVDMTSGVYRRVYAGYITGHRINGLSLEAEAWFWRLNAVADDYGNMRAEPSLLVAETVGLRQIKTEKVLGLVDEIVAAGLAYRYEVGRDQYLHIVGFEERQPCGRNGRRFKRHQLHPDAPGSTLGNPGESGGIQNNPVAPIPIPSPNPKPIPSVVDAGASPAVGVSLFEQFWKAWPNHKRKTDRKACLGYWTKSKLDAEGQAIVRSLTRWKRSEAWTDEGGAYIPLPLTWLRGERWKEKPKYAEAFAPPSAEAMAFAQELIDQKAIAEGMVDPRKEKANEAK